jgi:transposase
MALSWDGLSRYVDEQMFRYNDRATKDNKLTDSDRFVLAMSQVSGLARYIASCLKIHHVTRMDPLDQAQLRLLGLWQQKQMVSHRLLAYDTTNFYTYIASSNGRNQLAQRGHNKQGRHKLRQVGLSYVLDGENGLGLCHHVYPGHVADVDEFSTALARITWMLDQNQMERESVTVVLVKGPAALANTVALEEARLGWISALPWNQASAQLRSRAVEQLPLCGASQPGVRAAAEKLLVHGCEYLCVVKYSAPFAGEQLHSLTTSLSRALQALRRLNKELRQPREHCKREQIVRKINRWLSAPCWLRLSAISSKKMLKAGSCNLIMTPRPSPVYSKSAWEGQFY